MNPALHKPVALLHERCSVDPDSHVIRVQYRRDGPWQTFAPVHVPVPLEPLLDRDVDALHIETLQVNGRPQRAIAGAPDYLLAGVILRDGTRHGYLPAGFVAAKRRHLRTGITLLGLGVLTIALSTGSGSALLAALLVGWAVDELRISEEFRCRPFHVNTVVS